MKFNCVLIFVSDMEKSKKFFENILGLTVKEDFTENVIFHGGIALQTKKTWADFIEKDENEINSDGCSGELYFEEDDMDGFSKILADHEIRYVHKLKEHSWGQRVVRFFDPDGHIIEVGESLAAVVKRFSASGLTKQQIALRMDVSVAYVESMLKAKE